MLWKRKEANDGKIKARCHCIAHWLFNRNIGFVVKSEWVECRDRKQHRKERKEIEKNDNSTTPELCRFSVFDISFNYLPSFSKNSLSSLENCTIKEHNIDELNTEWMLLKRESFCIWSRTQKLSNFECNATDRKMG